MCVNLYVPVVVTKMSQSNYSNLEYKLYQSVLQTFGRDPALYMPDIEAEDAYSGANEETDVDDYKITGEAYDIQHLCQNKNYQLNFDAATRKWRLTLIVSGCTVSIFADRCLFQDYVQIRAPIKTTEGTIYTVGKGTVGHIQNCLHVPTMDVNLISTSQVTDQTPNLEIALRKGMCIIRDMSGMREDQVFRTREAQCVVDDLKCKGVPSLSCAYYSALEENIHERKLVYMECVLNDGLSCDYYGRITGEPSLMRRPKRR